MKFNTLNIGDIVLVKENSSELKYIVHVNGITTSGDLQLVQLKSSDLDKAFHLTNAIYLSYNPRSKHFSNPYQNIGVLGNIKNNLNSELLAHNIKEINEHNSNISKNGFKQVNHDFKTDNFTLDQLNKFLVDDVFISEVQSLDTNQVVPRFEYYNSLEKNQFQVTDMLPYYKGSENRYYTLHIKDLNSNEPYALTLYSKENHKGLEESFRWMFNQNITNESMSFMYHKILSDTFTEANKDEFTRIFTSLPPSAQQGFLEDYRRLSSDETKTWDEVNAEVKQMQQIAYDTPEVNNLDLRCVNIDFHEGITNDFSGSYYTYTSLNEAIKGVFNARQSESDHKTYLSFDLTNGKKIEAKIYVGENLGAFNPHKETITSYLYKKPLCFTPNGTNTRFLNELVNSFNPATKNKFINESTTSLSELSNIIRENNCSSNIVGPTPLTLSSEELSIYGLMDATRTLYVGTKEEMEQAKAICEMPIDKRPKGTAYKHEFHYTPELLKKDYKIVLNDVSEPYVFGKKTKFKLYVKLSHEFNYCQNYTITVQGNNITNDKDILNVYNAIKQKTKQKDATGMFTFNNAVYYERILNQYINLNDTDKFKFIWSKLSQLEKEDFKETSSPGGRLQLDSILKSIKDMPAPMSVLNFKEAFKAKYPKAENLKLEEKLVAQFIYDNYENITGEKFLGAHTAGQNETIIDIISTLKYDIESYTTHWDEVVKNGTIEIPNFRRSEPENIVEYTIPNWAIAPIVNGDYSGLSDDDAQKLEDFTATTLEEHGNAHFIVPTDDHFSNENMSLYSNEFLTHNDIDNLGGECTTLFILPSEKELLIETPSNTHDKNDTLLKQNDLAEFFDSLPTDPTQLSESEMETIVESISKSNLVENVETLITFKDQGKKLSPRQIDRIVELNITLEQKIYALAMFNVQDPAKTAINNSEVIYLNGVDGNVVPVRGKSFDAILNKYEENLKGLNVSLQENREFPDKTDSINREVLFRAHEKEQLITMRDLITQNPSAVITSDSFVFIRTNSGSYTDGVNSYKTLKSLLANEHTDLLTIKEYKGPREKEIRDNLKNNADKLNM